MTDDKDLLDRLTGDSTRRSVLKSGALATAGASLGITSSGAAAAQEEGEGVGEGGEFNENELFNQEQAQKGLMFRRVFEPNVPFTVVSPVIDFQPDVEEIQDNVWSEYNSRIIRYLGTDEHVLFFPANAAEMGPFDNQLGFTPDDEFFQEGALEDNTLDENELTNQAESLAAVRPQLFVMNLDTGILGDEESLVTVQFSEVREEQEEAVFNEFGVPDFNPTGGDEGE